MQFPVSLAFLTVVLSTQLHSEEKLVECEGGLAIPPSVTPGDYFFEYESATDCEQITYTLRNTEGGVKTPVNWVDSATATQLMYWTIPSCQQAPCAEQSAPRTVLPGVIVKDTTDLSYGIFRDEHYTPAVALVARRLEGAQPSQRIFLLLSGPAETRDGEVIFIDLEASSEFSGNEIRYNLTNKGDRAVELTSEVAEVAAGNVAVSWTPLTLPGFQSAYSFQGELSDLPISVDIGQSLDGSVSTQTVRMSENSALVVYVGGEPIAGANMTLYLPAQ